MNKDVKKIFNTLPAFQREALKKHFGDKLDKADYLNVYPDVYEFLEAQFNITYEVQIIIEDLKEETVKMMVRDLMNDNEFMYENEGYNLTPVFRLEGDL